MVAGAISPHSFVSQSLTASSFVPSSHPHLPLAWAVIPPPVWHGGGSAAFKLFVLIRNEWGRLWGVSAPSQQTGRKSHWLSCLLCRAALVNLPLHISFFALLRPADSLLSFFFFCYFCLRHQLRHRRRVGIKSRGLPHWCIIFTDEEAGLVMLVVSATDGSVLADEGGAPCSSHERGWRKSAE